MRADISGWTGSTMRLGALEHPQDPLVEDRAGVDDDRVVALERACPGCATTWSGVMSSEATGLFGAARTCRPLSWRIAYVRSSSGSRRAASSRTTSTMVSFGSRLRCVATPPNCRSRSTRMTRSALRCAATTAMLVAIVVVPTPPLGLYTATRRRGRAERQAVGRHDRGEVLRPLEAEQQRLDAGLDLARVERSRDDVVGAGLEEPDPLLDVVGRGHAQDRHRRHRRRGADLAAHLEAGLARLGVDRSDVDDRELVLGDLGERVVGVGRARDRVAGLGQDRRERGCAGVGAS